MWMPTTTAVQPPGHKGVEKNDKLSLGPRWRSSQIIHMYIYTDTHLISFCHILFIFLWPGEGFLIMTVRIFPLFISQASWVPHAFGLQLVSVSIIEPQLGVFHSLDTLQTDSPCQKSKAESPRFTRDINESKAPKPTKASKMLFALW